MDTFREVLKANDWKVNSKTKAERNPYHNDKHLLWEGILDATRRKDNSKFPFVFINLDNCHELFFAMENTPAIDDKAGVKKDKSSENTDDQEREIYATHSTDAIDYVAWGLFKSLLPTHNNKGFASF